MLYLENFIQGAELRHGRNDDISDDYESRLPGEPAEGVADKHVHPAQPRRFRVSRPYRF